METTNPDKDTPQLKVLVADDNRDGADGFAMLLELLGHQVRTAYSGKQAVAMAEEFRPELVMLDIGMPEMNGYEVARHLRQQPWGRDMVLVAITGWGQDEDRLQAQAAGFDHHRAKPVELDALDPIIAQARAKLQGPR
jgi:CheY-like chemotaxis protein